MNLNRLPPVPMPRQTSELSDLLPKLEEALNHGRDLLCHQRGSHGHWDGHLSSSALSTATAVSAIQAYLVSPGCPHQERSRWESLRDRGRQWLVRQQNPDGGWGDTSLSFSNISTTALAWAAMPPEDDVYVAAADACENWLRKAITLATGIEVTAISPQHLATAIRERYGKDHTFSVPILTALALQGRLGPLPEAWRLIPQLPFELAAFPRAWYAMLSLPVVSYALPALIAIGYVRFHHVRNWNLPWVGFRRAVSGRVLRILREIQPTSGGYLEAIPLTSFVSLSLIGAGLSEHPVVRDGLAFLERSVREDGSWAIDSNLATWATTLSVSSLQANNSNTVPQTTLSGDDQRRIREWLLAQQYREVHPYTRAKPGGWAWTDLSGGVPDADDTPGALLALSLLDDGSPDVLSAALSGSKWLWEIQNADGGIPTFCRGWGTLPFDRSSADLTAHAIRAWVRWFPRMPVSAQLRIAQALDRGIKYLLRTQRAEGAWAPLWFGNQHATDQENLVYGTSRVLSAGSALHATDRLSAPFADACRRASLWLLKVQNRDGGWGGAAQTPSSIEETALAVDALCNSLPLPPAENSTGHEPWADSIWSAIIRGCHWLLERTESGRKFPASPIGFYFAKLWYFETTYPLVYSLTAWHRVIVAARESLPQHEQEGPSGDTVS